MMEFNELRKLVAGSFYYGQFYLTLVCPSEMTESSSD